MKRFGLPTQRLCLLVMPWLFWASAAAQEDPGWPKEFTTDNARIIVYQPQVETWQAYSTIKGSAAVVAIRKDSESELVGSVRFLASTKTNFDTRTVLIYGKEVVSVRFSSNDPMAVEQMEKEVRSVHTKPHTIALDRMLAMVENSDSKAKNSLELSVEPPTIFYSDKPAILVLFNGEPVYSRIDDTDLMFAINTNWDLFQQTGSSNYYLLDEDKWLMAPSVEGPWKPIEKLPESFSKLPDHENWTEVRKHLTAKAYKQEDVPVVYSSTKPAELIITEGEPLFKDIPGTKLMYVTNTESDLMLHKSEATYYFLVSGRWFKATTLAGPWNYATCDLPEDFALIPPDHLHADVLASVPGTLQAQLAVQQAQVPQQATVNRNEARVNVTYNGEPEFKEIEGTTVTYAVNSPYDVVCVDGLYYCCYRGIWFVSPKPVGLYVVCHDVPTVIYTIPASCPVYHVTYVRVYGYTSTTVVYGYSSGYMGCYVYDGVVVYGTGYYYPPYVYYGPVYPVYYSYPYTYGVHAYYNPDTGTYARGASVYGPYGGAGRVAAYNPKTGTYARGVAAYGPYGGTAAVSAYNPRTDTRAAGYQSYNQYAHWGETVVEQGDKWAHTGHYSDAQGTRVGFETSEGGKGVGWVGEEHRGGVVKTRNDDLYVGKDGNVYKKDGDSWEKYTGTQRSTSSQVRAGDRSGSSTSRYGNYNQLNRDARKRSLGNERTNKYQSHRKSPTRSRAHQRSAPRRSGGLRRR